MVDSTKDLTEADEGTAYKSNKAYLGDDGGSSVTKAFEYNTTGLSWSSISISTSASNRWNYDKGGTPSGSTGGTRDVAGSTSGYYLYFEGSSPNFSSSNRYYWLRTANSYTLS